MSIKKAKEQGSVWSFGGENIKYGISKLMGPVEEGVKQRLYFQLGWDYTFEYDDDEVYFSYSLPYTFSMVTNLVNQITDMQHKLIQEFKNKRNEDQFHDPKINENSFKLVETSNITTSLGGIDVPMLTITDFSHTRDEE